VVVVAMVVAALVLLQKELPIREVVVVELFRNPTQEELVARADLVLSSCVTQPYTPLTLALD
jgi:hypothetical protein